MFILAMRFSLWESQITLRVVFPKAGVSLHVLANNLIYPSVYLFFNSDHYYDVGKGSSPLRHNTHSAQSPFLSSVSKRQP